MAALSLLLGAALLLLALGAAARAAPTLAPAAMSVLCLAGLAAALAAPTVATLAGPVAFGIDGLSAAILAALFLWGAAVRRNPTLLGALALAILAADGLSLLAATALTLAASGAFARPTRIQAALALVALAATLLLLGGLDLRFAAMRDGVEGLRAAAILLTTLAAAALLPHAIPGLPGSLAALYLTARTLLDLAGPATPAWWGIPILALGAALALDAARRTLAATHTPHAAALAETASLAIATAAIGAALLARGADLPPLVALAVTAALLQTLHTAAWSGLLALSTQACIAAVGGPDLARTGGLLRRMPATGLAMLVALVSMAAFPATAGFAGAWLAAQAVLGAGRTGGIAITMLAAAALAALGYALALLAAAAIRLAGISLLGAPRTAKAAAATEPPWRLRAGMAALALATLVLGACPGLIAWLVQPAARLLAGTPAEGANLLLLAPGLDMPGYAAPALAVLLALALAAATWSTRGPPARAPAWQGGFIEDGIGRTNTLARHWPPLPRLPWPRILLAALALALAATIGWAAR